LISSAPIRHIDGFQWIQGRQILFSPQIALLLTAKRDIGQWPSQSSCPKGARLSRQHPGPAVFLLDDVFDFAAPGGRFFFKEPEKRFEHPPQP
jgi:hypothetical protein